MKVIKKKYGFWTAVAMVVGVVIGSGVFFKADDVLKASGGNVRLSLYAWIVGAISMIFGALVFAECSTRFERSNGIVDYAEEMVSPRYAFLIGWFNAVIYYPALTAVLAWVSGLYTSILLGRDGNFIWYAAIFYAVALALLNYFAPKLAGKFQVSTTIIKLIPLVLFAIVGIYIGINNEAIINNFSTASLNITSGKGFAGAVLSTAFAYEGWIIATTLNSEIKDSKRNLKRALVFGSMIVVIIYISYFIGITGLLPVEEIIDKGDSAVNLAANKIFGQFGVSILTTFVIISCLGTLNGLNLACSRSFYSLAIRGQGPKPELFNKINPKTNVPTNSAKLSYIFIALYLLIWFGNFNGWFDTFIDISELPIALIYGLYVSIYIAFMIKIKDLSFLKRFITPILALLGASIVIYGGLSKESVMIDLAISFAIFGSGLLFYKKTS